MTGPHDRFFRYLFTPPARAEALLRHNLPVHLAAEIDWSSLRRESGTLVDWGRETRKDLLFSARKLHTAQDEPPHYFLIEHQSAVERWMALRLLDYVWRLLTHWRELHTASRWIPEVSVLVVYPRHGRRWSAPLRLEDLYRAPVQDAGARRRRLEAVRFEYRVDDLSTQSEQAIRARPGSPLVTLGLLVLCFAGTAQLAQRLPYWSDLFAQVDATTHGPQALYRVVRYLHQLGDELAHDALQRVLHSFMQPERAEALMRTMEEVLKERGHRQGWLEGKASGLAVAILRLLAARGVDVDDTSRQRIQDCRDVATLERWLERALNATQLSEVMDGPT